MEQSGGLMYNLACILDLARKLSLYERWDQLEGTHYWVNYYRTEFCQFYNRHYLPLASEPATASQSPPAKRPKIESYRHKLLKHSTSSQTSKSTELSKYLDTELVELQDIDPLLWWKANEKQYPSLSRMVRRILVIPISSVGVECVFSVARDVIPY